MPGSRQPSGYAAGVPPACPSASSSVGENPAAGRGPARCASPRRVQADYVLNGPARFPGNRLAASPSSAGLFG